jgi:hypothetical protein
MDEPRTKCPTTEALKKLPVRTQPRTLTEEPIRVYDLIERDEPNAE